MGDTRMQNQIEGSGDKEMERRDAKEKEDEEIQNWMRK